MWYFYTPVIVHVISYITLHFTHVRSIEMCHVFVFLCSLHSSVWCGLWLNMCDIRSVVYTRWTYYISFHMPQLHNIPSIALRCTKRKQIPAQLFYSLISSWFGYTNWRVWWDYRDYTCRFLYPLLRLTTSLLTCWGIAGCDRSISHLFCWVLAGLVTSRLFTYPNNFLVYYICLYLRIVFKWPVSCGSPLSSGIFFPKC